MEQTKLKRFKRILFIILLTIVMVGGISYLSFGRTHNTYNTPSIEIIKTQPVDTVSTKDSIKEEIIGEVSEYLKKQAPTSHKFIPKYIVQAGLNYNIDICFMMAQTQLETNFGTTGAGRESSRRSLFGVAIRRYGDYETAINDYCQILHKSYLGKGRTEKHLMAKYVTHSGARYAGNSNYEAELSRTYKDILKKTRIHTLQIEWNEKL